jgi:hypothetical protein
MINQESLSIGKLPFIDCSVDAKRKVWNED